MSLIQINGGLPIQSDQLLRERELYIDSNGVLWVGKPNDDETITVISDHYKSGSLELLDEKIKLGGNSILSSDGLDTSTIKSTLGPVVATNSLYGTKADMPSDADAVEGQLFFVIS